MADAFYNAGTCSLTPGSATVSGANCAWSEVVRPGDVFEKNGRAISIRTVVSNTELLLEDPWPEAAQVAVSYRIRYAPDAARLTGAITDLLAVLRNGNLQSLAAAEGAANRFPIWQGAGTIGAASVSDLALDLLDEADPAGWRALLELQGIRALAGALGINIQPKTASTSKAFVGGDVSIAGNAASLCMNCYYDGSWKFLANGWAAVLKVEPTTGRFLIFFSLAENENGPDQAVPFGDPVSILSDSNILTGKFGSASQWDSAYRSAFTNIRYSGGVLQVFNNADGWRNVASV